VFSPGLERSFIETGFLTRLAKGEKKREREREREKERERERGKRDQAL